MFILKTWSVFVGIITMSISSLFLYSCCDLQVKCPPDNRPVNCIKSSCLDKVYPTYASTYDSDVKATVKVLDKVEITASAVVKQQIHSFRQELTGEQALVQDCLKMAIIAINMEPCDKERTGYLLKLAEKVINNASELSRVRLYLVSTPV